VLVFPALCPSLPTARKRASTVDDEWLENSPNYKDLKTQLLSMNHHKKSFLVSGFTNDSSRTCLSEPQRPCIGKRLESRAREHGQGNPTKLVVGAWEKCLRLCGDGTGIRVQVVAGRGTAPSKNWEKFGNGDEFGLDVLNRPRILIFFRTRYVMMGPQMAFGFKVGFGDLRGLAA